MAIDPRQHVNPGDPIRLAASQINGLNRLLSPGAGYAGGEVIEPAVPYTWVHGRANSAIGRWQPVAITGLSVVPTSSFNDTYTNSFEANPVVFISPVTQATGDWGDGGFTPRQFGVAVEPIAADAIGRVAISGLVQVRLVNRSNNHPFVRCTSSGTLESGWSGTASIVWRGGAANSNTEQWALVRLGQEHHRTLLNGTFTAPWAKHSYNDVNVGGVGPISVRNTSAQIAGSGTKSCIIAYVNSEDSTYEWQLVAAEYTYQQQQ